jgi:hypothetical protein
MNRSRFAEIIERHRITYGVVGALIAALLLTMVSMALYISSGASRLDLSRPGYEKIRGEVQTDSNEGSFSSSGPISSSVLKDFQQRYNKHRGILNKLDTYATNALDDSELQIVPTPASNQGQ